MRHDCCHPGILRLQRLAGHVTPSVAGKSSALYQSASLRPFLTSSAVDNGNPKSIKLYYHDSAFWRAECIRICLFIGEVPFADVRDKSNDDLKAEGKLPFGSVPVMEVDGQILSQTQAILSYCGKLAGLQSEDPWLVARVDEVINGCTDVTGTIGSTFSLPAAEKVKKRQELISSGGRLTMELSGLEGIVAGNGCKGHAVGTSLSVADLAIWRLSGWLSNGSLDGVPSEYVSSNFPEIAGVCASVDSHPKVQEWKAKYPKFYKK